MSNRNINKSKLHAKQINWRNLAKQCDRSTSEPDCSYSRLWTYKAVMVMVAVRGTAQCSREADDFKPYLKPFSCNFLLNFVLCPLTISYLCFMYITWFLFTNKMSSLKISPYLAFSVCFSLWYICDRVPQIMGLLQTYYTGQVHFKFAACMSPDLPE